MAMSQRVFGRTAELETIAAAAEAVRASGVPRFIIIEGPPGVGKTSLLNEAARHLPGWWRANVYLDPEDRDRPGYGARHLLRKSQRYGAPSEAQALGRMLRQQSDAIREPVLTVMEDLQWLDPLSADVLYSIVREVEDVPLLTLVTARSTSRPELMRFVRYAQTAGEAQRIVLEPFTRTEVRSLLQKQTGLPISAKVAERVHDATGGFPSFLDHVIERLTSGEDAVSAAALEAALSELEQGEGPAQRQRLLVRQVLEESPEQVQEMLALLSLAQYPLSVHELGALLGDQSVDVEALRLSSLVHEAMATGRFSLRHKIFERCVVADLGREQRVELQMRLAKEESGTVAVRHRAEVAMLDPTVEDRLSTVEQLIEAAQAASRSGDTQETLALTRLAFEVERSGPVLECLAFAAMRAGSRIDVESTVAWAKSHDVHPVLRRGILARESLRRGDLESSLRFLAGGSDLGGASPKALLCYADTVLQTSRTAGLRGSYWHLFKIADRTVAALLTLEARVRAGDPEVRTLIATSEQLLAEATGLRVCLQLWQTFEAIEAGRPQSFSQEVQKLLDQARRVPGTESAQMMLLVGRGAVLRTSGRPSEAYADLSTAIENWTGSNRRALAYAEIHMSYLLFEAGLWSEALAFAESAASEVLDIAEDNMAPVAFAAAHLIPAARGQHESQGWSFNLRAQLSRGSDTALGRAGRGFVEAWAATAAQDHERVVSSVLAMQVEQSLWSRSATAAILLGRSMLRTGRAQALPSLIARLRVEDHAAEAHRDYVLRHLRGLADAGLGRHAQAYEHFSAALSAISATPALKSRHVPGDGGALSLYRGLLALDMGRCVVLGAEALQDKADEVAELALWAASMFQGCGAEGLFQQADEVFLSLRKVAEGGGSGKPHVMDLPEHLSSKARFALTALTSREREIALMVGQGLTNKDVAEELVISVRTVEYHVANALGKLTLDSRHDLRRLLQTEDEEDDDARRA